MRSISDLMLESARAYIFVRHIKQHFKDDPISYCKDSKVICKICGITINEIWNEYREDQKLRNQTV